MGQARNRKAEIEQLKAKGPKVKEVESKPDRKSNIQIAKEYSDMAFNMTADGGSWMQSNFDQLSTGEQYAVLQLYKSKWHQNTLQMPF